MSLRPWKSYLHVFFEAHYSNMVWTLTWSWRLTGLIAFNSITYGLHMTWISYSTVYSIFMERHCLDLDFTLILSLSLSPQSCGWLCHQAGTSHRDGTQKKHSGLRLPKGSASGVWRGVNEHRYLQFHISDQINVWFHFISFCWTVELSGQWNYMGLQYITLNQPSFVLVELYKCRLFCVMPNTEHC